MGPRHYSRGNSKMQSGKEEELYEFQWGHDITVVETYIHEPGTNNFHPVSMGPRHYSRGNIVQLHQVEKIHEVSMGPRHYSRGNKPICRKYDLHHLVSMGPRHYSRGNI